MRRRTHSRRKRRLKFGLYARDLRRVWRVAEALEYGKVGINTGAISSAVRRTPDALNRSALGRKEMASQLVEIA